MINVGSSARGQALVEFAFVLPLFLILVVGVFDLGRGIYQFNGVSQAAREIARVTSVHRGPACPPTCTSTETVNVIATQKSLIPMLGDPTFQCVSEAGVVKPDAGCAPGDGVRVTAFAPYTALMPLLGLANAPHPPCVGNSFTCMQGVSTVKIQ